MRILALVLVAAQLVGSEQPPSPAAAPAAPAPAASTTPSVPPPAGSEAAETLGYDADPNERMTVAVNVAGRGPFSFIVDTGAERTVISRELAGRLGLPSGGSATVHSTTERVEVSTARIPTLAIGRREVRDIHAPVLLRHDLGAEGLLGLDSLQRERVTFDFVRQELTVTPSPSRLAARGRRLMEREDGTIVVTARSLLGRLILTSASVAGQRVQVVIDTGAALTIGNSALRQRLESTGRLPASVPIEVRSVTGGRLTVDYTVAGRIRLGAVSIDSLPIGFADAPVFRQLGLDDRPALLLGMDALRLFNRISIDFANREIRFEVPTSGLHGLPSRMAAAGGERAAR